jgi:hypothetical protein
MKHKSKSNLVQYFAGESTVYVSQHSYVHNLLRNESPNSERIYLRFDAYKPISFKGDMIDLEFKFRKK